MEQHRSQMWASAQQADVTKIQLLEEILDEVRYQNAPARRREEQRLEADLMQEVLDRDRGRCRCCRRLVDLSDAGRRGLQGKAFLRVDQEVGPPYVLLCRQCRVYASGSEESLREVIDSVGATALTARPVGEQGPELLRFAPNHSLTEKISTDAEAIVREVLDGSEPRNVAGRGLGAGPVPREDRDGCSERDPNPHGVAPLVSELEFHSVILRDLRKLLLHLVDVMRVQVDMDPVDVKLGHDGALLFVDDAGEGSVPEGAGDTPEASGRLTHYVFVTPEGRPFLSRMLCDLAGDNTDRQTASSEWSRVTCPKCRDLGPDLAAELLEMSDAALISLGAVPAGVTVWDAVTQ